MEFSLRAFRVEDFEVLWSIDQKCFAPGIAYPRRELAAYIQRRGAFTLVAERAGRRPGAVSGFIVAEAGGRGVGHIITIDVLPDNRRGGMGSQLLVAAEERLRQTDCHTVMLETAVDNVSALAFYKRHGYTVEKVVPQYYYYSTGVDAFVMEKQLSVGWSSVRGALTAPGVSLPLDGCKPDWKGLDSVRSKESGLNRRLHLLGR